MMPCQAKFQAVLSEEQPGATRSGKGRCFAAPDGSNSVVMRFVHPQPYCPPWLIERLFLQLRYYFCGASPGKSPVDSVSISFYTSDRIP